MLDFIATLVVVNTAFTHTCLRLLVASLLPHTQQPVSTDSDAQLGPWQPSEEDMAVQHAITETLIKVRTGTYVICHPKQYLGTHQHVVHSAHIPTDTPCPCLFAAPMVLVATGSRPACVCVCVCVCVSMCVPCRC